ncbi:hypothetical protein L7F22_008639 [Adiantum nelumboides]|nr:hypothetical protein [Adiantum nelumboides]
MAALLIIVAREPFCHVSGPPAAGFVVCYFSEVLELSCHQSAHSFSEGGDNGMLTVMYMFDILKAPGTSSFQLDGCGEAHDALQELFNVSVPDEDEGEAVILDSQRHFHVAQAETAHCEVFEVLSYAHPPHHHAASEAQPFWTYGSIEEVVGCRKPLLQLIRNPISAS